MLWASSVFTVTVTWIASSSPDDLPLSMYLFDSGRFCVVRSSTSSVTLSAVTSFPTAAAKLLLNSVWSKSVALPRMFMSMLKSTEGDVLLVPMPPALLVVPPFSVELVSVDLPPSAPPAPPGPRDSSAFPGDGRDPALSCTDDRRADETASTSGCASSASSLS